MTQEMQLSFGNLSHSYDADGPCVDGLSHQNVCFSPELVMIVNDLYQRVPSSTEVRGCQFRDVTSQVIGHPSYKMDEFYWEGHRNMCEIMGKYFEMKPFMGKSSINGGCSIHCHVWLPDSISY